MVKIYILVIALAATVVLTISPADALYTIDGNVLDWGINLNLADSKPYLDNNLPSGGNDIDVITEDNADKYDGSTFVEPGYSPSGNLLDAESIYFDNDETYAYIAIITGLSQSNTTYPAGDVFLQVGATTDPFISGYTPTSQSFAINISDNTFGTVNTWNHVSVSAYTEANPFEVASFKSSPSQFDLGSNFVYSTVPVNSHYVMEARIPLSTLGLHWSGTSDVWIHWTMSCGNDYLNLRGDVNNPIPEPSSLLLLGGGVLGFMGFRRNKKLS